MGAAERARSSIGARVWVADQPSVKETLAALEASLGANVLEERLSSGRRLPLDEVLRDSSRRDIELQG
jgi:hypothetical protein